MNQTMTSAAPGTNTLPAMRGAPPANQQVQTQQQQAPVKRETVKSLLASDYFKHQIALALPKHMTADRFIRVALTACMRTPALLECTRESLTKCLLDCSQTGLEPDGRRAHLIPFKNKKKNITECTLIIDYKGYAELVLNSGLASNIHADVVCENDEFEYDRGELKVHKIDFRKPRGNPYAVYCLIRFKDGSEKVEVMAKDEVLAVRDKSSGYQAFKAGYTFSNPWMDKQSEPEMWKKTVFKRAAKWVKLSPEIQDALEKDKTDVPVAAAGLVIDTPMSLIGNPEDMEQLTEGNGAEGNGHGEEPQEDAPEETDDKPEAQKPAPASNGPIHTVQDTLAETVTKGGFNYDQFKEFLRKSKHLPDPEPYPGFAELPGDLCRVLNRQGAKIVDSIRKHIQPLEGV